MARRRSARLNKANQQQNTPSAKSAVAALQLGSLLERDETPDAAALPQSIDDVVETPASAAAIKDHITKLSGIRTPKTEPRPERGQMHPKTVQATTTKTPDSGLKLGFVDIPSQPPRTVASLQNTPSKSREDLMGRAKSSKFEFRFGSDNQLSAEAQKLMDNLREEAARIRVQMEAEKAIQDDKDREAEEEFHGVNAAGRKIAKPKGRSGRFSDVHMAQFRKMDSIANHPSAFRARPGFAQPTAQSLKRSISKADLDEAERPRTAGKGTPGKTTPVFSNQTYSTGPFNSLPAVPSDRSGNTVPAKRQRITEAEDVSSVAAKARSKSMCTTSIPRPTSSTLFSPTKASLARSSQIPVSSPKKGTDSKSSINYPKIVASYQPQSEAESGNNDAEQRQLCSPGTKINTNKPLPAVPSSTTVFQLQSAFNSPVKSATPGTEPLKPNEFSSKLPKLTGLKSILRSTRKSAASANAPSQPGTPKITATANKNTDSTKKVDFTPSVKSRYAVKLAAGSPSPAKLPHLTPYRAPAEPVFPYDPAAYVIEDEDDEENWEDAESIIEYPTLPEPEVVQEGPAVKTFTQKAKDHNRRESKEFKSIFTTLHHPSRPSQPSSLTSVNTNVNRTDPAIHANKVLQSPQNPILSMPSPSTIRRVESAGVTELVQPFEDAHLKTVPHGLPGKKRRRTSIIHDDRTGADEETKENRRMHALPPLPGGWNETLDDEGDQENRSFKRVRTTKNDDELDTVKTEIKKPSAAREAAARNAKERKSRGILSLSRLNVLSRPKQRP